jgi:hypothetical protein
METRRMTATRNAETVIMKKFDERRITNPNTKRTKTRNPMKFMMTGRMQKRL